MPYINLLTVFNLDDARDVQVDNILHFHGCEYEQLANTYYFSAPFSDTCQAVETDLRSIGVAFTILYVRVKTGSRVLSNGIHPGALSNINRIYNR